MSCAYTGSISHTQKLNETLFPKNQGLSVGTLIIKERENCQTETVSTETYVIAS